MENQPRIKGFLESSFVDWPDRVCAAIFIGGCNFRCPYCHNHELVLHPEALSSLTRAEIQERLRSLKRWLGGVCISGGEPTLDPGLGPLLKELKQDGWSIKLDTNGSRPDVLKALIVKGLVDMVAMDVKAPPAGAEKYSQCAGVAVDLDAIQDSIAVIRQSGLTYQFRMTVLPLFHTREDVQEWVKALGKGPHLKLQNFNPQSTLNPSFGREIPFEFGLFAELCRLTVKEEIF